MVDVRIVRNDREKHSKNGYNIQAFHQSLHRKQYSKVKR